MFEVLMSNETFAIQNEQFGLHMEKRCAGAAFDNFVCVTEDAREKLWCACVLKLITHQVAHGTSWWIVLPHSVLYHWSLKVSRKSCRDLNWP